MTCWAIAYMNYFEDELTIEFIRAPTRLEALAKHPDFQEKETKRWLAEIIEEDRSIEKIKEDLFNMDVGLEIEEVPNE